LLTIIKFGVAGVLGFTLLVMSTGLEASPPVSADLAPRVERATRGEVDDPVPPETLSHPRLLAEAEELITPEALQQLVLIQSAQSHRAGADVECMAKVIYHEAANQALPGQLAVAQVILNRTRGGPTFPKTACGVVNQDGQFFKTRRFRAPPSDRARWRVAVAIAFIAKEKHLAQVAPGALFYHAAYVRPAWRRRHERIARIGDHIFYR
jgi:spore germination cell wall hydrolase CwlJ-like protein